MPFLSDLGRFQARDEDTTSQREFNITDLRMGHGKCASETRNTRSTNNQFGEINQTFQTRSRIASTVRGSRSTDRAELDLYCGVPGNSQADTVRGNQENNTNG